MNVLAIDGALGAFSAAVARDRRILASLAEPGAVALERGLAIVEAAMRNAAIAADQIDRLAVGIGPGSFTGLRIAITYAKSLASAWTLPLVPIDSFDLLEYGGSFERVLSVVLGRTDIISARYRSEVETRRASGRTNWVLDALGLSGAALRPSMTGSKRFSADDGTATEVAPLAVVGAPKDVLDALAERGIIVRAFNPAVTPAAAAAAVAAVTRTPPSTLHEVRADYGELPAAKPPRF